jgi:uncharacterized protein (UPF0210 family)
MKQYCITIVHLDGTKIENVHTNEATINKCLVETFAEWPKGAIINRDDQMAKTGFTITTKGELVGYSIISYDPKE